MNKKVLCFGELLLRISPAPEKDPMAEKQPMVLYVGGAEANVATALAGWNVPVKYCTVLPDNFMSRHVIDYLEYRGIYSSSVLFGGDRIGLYYLEQGEDLKGNMVYDRAHSSFSELKPGVIDWDRVLRDVCWLDFSAISPAINENVAAVCLEAVKAASEKNIKISIDLNYRSRLWKYGKQPIDVMPEIVQYCDLIMGNIWSANTCLGIPVDEHIHDKKSKQAYLDHAVATSEEIIRRYPKCHSVGNTFRFDGIAHNSPEQILYYTSLYSEGKSYVSPEFTCARVVDRSGSGDCFMAGLVYGFYNHHDPQDIVNYATAAAFGKLQVEGDTTDQDIFKVAKLRKSSQQS